MIEKNYIPEKIIKSVITMIKKIIINVICVSLIFILCDCEKEENPVSIENPPPNSENSTLLYTADAGLTWEIYKLYYCDKMFSIASFNRNPYASIIITGSKGTIIRSLDGGGNWEVDTLGIMKLDLNDLASTGANLSGIAVGNQGSILRTNNDGQSWNYAVTPTSSDLYSVKFDTVSGIGVAAGIKETIIRSIDRGQTWSIITSNLTSSVVYRKVAIPGSKKIIIVGYNESTGQPLIVRSENSGVSWSSVTLPLTDSKLFGVSFLDSLKGIAVGSAGKILKTTNGGISWTLKNTGISNDINSVFCSHEIFIAAGSKVILRSSDRGESWSSNTIENANGSLFGIFRLDVNNFFITGE